MKLEIPEISDERLTELFKRIKPLVRDKRGIPMTIKPPHLRDQAYTWSPKLMQRGPKYLSAIGDFRCLHTYGYYGLFKPSIAEVLAQMPENLAKKATHFEIVDSPRNASDLNDEAAALNAGFHVSTVRVYQMEKRQ